MSKIPGVGKKTASRIILELKGSLDQGLASLFDEGEAPAARAAEQLRGAHEALLSMGFTAAEADLALKGAPEGVSDSAVLQYALKRSGNRALTRAGACGTLVGEATDGTACEVRRLWRTTTSR